MFTACVWLPLAVIVWEIIKIYASLCLGKLIVCLQTWVLNPLCMPLNVYFHFSACCLGAGDGERCIEVREWQVKSLLCRLPLRMPPCIIHHHRHATNTKLLCKGQIAWLPKAVWFVHNSVHLRNFRHSSLPPNKSILSSPLPLQALFCCQRQPPPYQDLISTWLCPLSILINGQPSQIKLGILFG